MALRFSLLDAGRRMRRIVGPLGTWMVLLGGCGGTPELPSLPELQWNSFRDYRALPYIRAANVLQELGREKACRILEREAQTNPRGNQVVVLCRMLFTAKAGSEFRRPLIGAATFLGGTDYGDWPLEPIVSEGGVPFLITSGYTGLGFPEPSSWYLQYCMAKCDWKAERLHESSDSDLKRALEKLIASKKWKRPLDATEREFLSAQIE